MGKPHKTTLFPALDFVYALRYDRNHIIPGSCDAIVASLPHGDKEADALYSRQF